MLQFGKLVEPRVRDIRWHGKGMLWSSWALYPPTGGWSLRAGATAYTARLFNVRRKISLTAARPQFPVLTFATHTASCEPLAFPRMKLEDCSHRHTRNPRQSESRATGCMSDGRTAGRYLTGTMHRRSDPAIFRGSGNMGAALPREAERLGGPGGVAVVNIARRSACTVRCFEHGSEQG